MAETDKTLAKELREAMKKPRNFLFIHGKADTALIVSAHKIAGKMLAEAKTRSGGGPEVRGQCFGEDGTLVFQTVKEPPGGLDTKIRQAMKVLAGVSLPVEVRGGGTSEEIEQTGTESETETPTSGESGQPAGEGVATVKRLLALAEPFKQAVARKGPDLARIQQLHEQARTLVAAKDFAKANAALDVLTPLLTAPTTAPSSTAPAVDGVAVVKRLLGLTAKYQSAVARKGPEAAQLQKLYEGARALVDGKKFAEATVILNKLVPLLAAPPAPTAPPPATEGVAVAKRLLALTGPIKDAVAGKNPEAANLQKLYDEARAHVAAKDFAKANAVLDELEKLLSPSAKTAEVEPVPEVKAGETAAAWQAACAKVEKQITAWQKTLRQAGNPDLRFIADRGARKLQKQLGAGLEKALTEFDRSTVETRKQARTQVAALMLKAQTFLKKDPALALMDHNPFGATMTVRVTLEAALKGITKALVL